MTNSEVRHAISEKLNMLFAQTGGGVKEDFTAGLISGMLEAFQVAGFIDREQGERLYDDFMEVDG